MSKKEIQLLLNEQKILNKICSARTKNSAGIAYS
jgi:hypothetical protein